MPVMSEALLCARLLRHPHRGLLIFDTREALETNVRKLIDEQRTLEAECFRLRAKGKTAELVGLHVDYRISQRLFVNKAKGLVECRIRSPALARLLRGRSFVYVNLAQHAWPESLHVQVAPGVHYPFPAWPGAFA